MKKQIATTLLALSTLSFLLSSCSQIQTEIIVTNFEDCEKVGTTIMEGFPRQCIYGDQSFTEDFGNEVEKSDKITISSPRPGNTIESPLTITGEARGPWFFEATFPVTLKDENGNTVASGIAHATEDWMTEEFIPYESTLEFSINEEQKGKKGRLILENDNPSGLEENADSLELPVIF